MGKRLGPPVAAGAIILGIALLNSFQLQRNWELSGAASAPFAWLLAGELAEATIWALALAAIIAVDRRAGLQAGRGIRAVPVHLLLFLLVFAVQNGVMTFFTRLVDPIGAGTSYGEAFLLRGGFKLPSAVVIYGMLLGGFCAWELARQRSRDALERANLRAELAGDRLQQLKDQIHPHFLFNTLHLIGSLVREGQKDQAVETISQLSDLLRRALHDVDQHLVTVRDEVAFLERYISIQQLRFGPQLAFHLELEPRAEGARVPGLILQPLVENAVTHGLDLERRPGRIAVRVSVCDQRLVLEVEDNGRGYAEGARNGIPLSHLRSRLHHLFGPEHDMQVMAVEGGTRVRVRIPLELADSRDGSPASVRMSRQPTRAPTSPDESADADPAFVPSKQLSGELL